MNDCAEGALMDRERILTEIARVNRLWKDSPLSEQLKGAKFFAAQLLFVEFENTFEQCQAEVEKACRDTKED